MIRFYVVSCRCGTAGVEGPFFDVFEVRYVVPAREFRRPIHDEPDAALSVVGYLIERLRATTRELSRALR